MTKNEMPARSQELGLARWRICKLEESIEKLENELSSAEEMNGILKENIEILKLLLQRQNDLSEMQYKEIERLKRLAVANA